MDITLFRDIPSPKSRTCGMGMNVLASGKITFNKKLMTALDECSRAVSIKMTADGRHLLLQPDKYGYVVPTRGILLNLEFSRHLVSIGLSLPIHYNVEYSSELEGWLGTADTTTCIDNYVNRSTKKRMNKKPATSSAGAVL